MNIASFNARSIPSHICDINFLLFEKQYDLVLITETWLFAGASSDLFHSNEYNLYRRDRCGRRGGGVAIYVRDCLAVEELDFANVDGVEQLWLSVIIGRVKVAVGIVYRPPCVSYTKLDCLTQPLEYCFLNFQHIIFGGDFNIDFLDPSNSRCKHLMSIVQSFNFHQMITQATRVTTSSSTLLDLLFVLNPSLIINTNNCDSVLSTNNINEKVDSLNNLFV